MRLPLRTRWAMTLLLGGLMATLVSPPVLALSHGDSSVLNATGSSALRSLPQSPLATGVVRKPDGRIRYGSHGYPGSERGPNLPFVGNNVYNTTAARQGATVENFNELEGAYYTFDISIQNDGNRADRFRVKATGAASTGWTIRYSRGTTNITAAVIAGTYQTASLGPGATYLIRARMTVKTGAGMTRLVTIRSGADPTKVDAVKFVYKAISCGC